MLYFVSSSMIPAIANAYETVIGLESPRAADHALEDVLSL